MKPKLEVLSFDTQNKSINYFELEAPVFKPFWHYHPELELTLITKGNGTRFVGNSIEAYHEGDLVLIGEHLPHHWVSTEDSKEQGAIVLQFSPSLFHPFSECNYFHDFFKEAQAGFHFTQPETRILELFNQLGSASAVGRIGGLLQLLESLVNDQNRKSLSNLTYPAYPLLAKNQTKVNRAVTYILEHINEQLTVNHMSDITHMVPQSFCRWFRKAIGMSFITFLNNTRIENACHELMISDKPIHTIAFNNGFASISHFNRTFKKVKRETPGNYRRRRTDYI